MSGGTYLRCQAKRALRVLPQMLGLSLLLLAERMAFSSKLLALSNMTYSIFLVEYFTTSAYKRLIPDAPGLPATVLSLAALFAVTFAISVIPYELIEVRLTSRLRKIFLPS